MKNKLLFLFLGLFISNSSFSFSSKQTEKKVWVYQSDQSKSCGMAEGIEVEKMAKDLEKEKIKIFEQKKSNDGRMHIQVCGGPTGQINTYEIRQSDLEKAKSIGFLELSSDLQN